MSHQIIHVVGLAPHVMRAAVILRELHPDRDIQTLELPLLDEFTPDMKPTETLDRATSAVFAACDERALNFTRFGLFFQLKARGFQFVTCISPRASMAPNVKIGQNVFVASGVDIGSGATVEYNSILRGGVRIADGARIGHSVYVGASANIGVECTIGDNSVIGPGVLIGDGVKVGKNCSLMVPGLYTKDVTEKTFYEAGYDGPIRIERY